VGTVLVISFTDLGRDPRVKRQIDALRTAYTVIAAGTGDPGTPGVRFIACARAPRTLGRKLGEALELLTHRYDAFYARQAHVRELKEKLGELDFDLAIANDVEALPLALAVAGRRPVILDAHEYAPRELEERAVWRIFKQGLAYYLCRTYLARATRVVTVAQGIADEYARVFGVKPVVIDNAAPAHSLLPRPAPTGVWRMLHHGHAMPTRRIDTMIDVMRGLDDRFRLDLVLVPTFPRYLEQLKRMAEGDERIRFLPPVPVQEIVPFSNAYDIGLYLLQPTSFNNLHALPNKFFEFLQARVVVAIGPSPEMARIVREFDCGIVAPDFSPASLAKLLNGLTSADIDRMKGGSDRAARVHHAEGNAEKLRALVASALEGRS